MDDQAMAPGKRVSAWSITALMIGAVWAVAAVAGSAADYALTQPWKPDPQAMFGGHLIAFFLLIAALFVGVAVLIAAGVGIIQCLRSGKEVVGIGRAVAGIVLATVGSIAAYLAFVQ